MHSERFRRMRKTVKIIAVFLLPNLCCIYLGTLLPKLSFLLTSIILVFNFFEIMSNFLN